jgi:3-methylfumaryl-CoA hydratase
MMDADALDAAALQAWAGRTEHASDDITSRLVREFCAAFDLEASIYPVGSPAPLMLHWCLAPATAKASALGPDGHPRQSEFLPPVPLPRRMWAGGALVLRDELRVGDAVERRSRIAGVAVKSGRSGTLCFVSVEHEFLTPRGLAISERQDIVYRPMPAALADPAPPPQLPEPQWRHRMQADPVLLFRYSALTFNSHRIHYDLPYATQTEFYPGLLVHGPLQATFLAQFAGRLHGAPPRNFSFRALQPLIESDAFQLGARERDGGLHLWIETEAGAQTMEAQAGW